MTENRLIAVSDTTDLLVAAYGDDALGRRYKFTSYDSSDPNDPNTSETTYYYYPVTQKC